MIYSKRVNFPTGWVSYSSLSAS